MRANHSSSEPARERAQKIWKPALNSVISAANEHVQKNSAVGHCRAGAALQRATSDEGEKLPLPSKCASPAVRSPGCETKREKWLV
jgi:hypothetical protein